MWGGGQICHWFLFPRRKSWHSRGELLDHLANIVLVNPLLSDFGLHIQSGRGYTLYMHCRASADDNCQILSVAAIIWQRSLTWFWFIIQHKWDLDHDLCLWCLSVTSGPTITNRSFLRLFGIWSSSPLQTKTTAIAVCLTTIWQQI